jgi:FkbM family methyltransferase
MGAGPFTLRRYSKALIAGHPHDPVMTSIREIWARDEYLGQGFLSVGNNAVVLDLGSNVGAFSLLALAANSSSRVFAVEPNQSHIQIWRTNMARNGFQDRAAVLQAFVGDCTEAQDELRLLPECRDAVNLAPQALLDRLHLETIDLLKCDIEGSEFSMLADGLLLQRTRQLAIEVHEKAGSCAAFHALLAKHGFNLKVIRKVQDFEVLCARR